MKNYITSLETVLVYDDERINIGPQRQQVGALYSPAIGARKPKQKLPFIIGHLKVLCLGGT